MKNMGRSKSVFSFVFSVAERALEYLGKKDILKFIRRIEFSVWPDYKLPRDSYMDKYVNGNAFLCEGQFRFESNLETRMIRSRFGNLLDVS